MGLGNTDFRKAHRQAVCVLLGVVLLLCGAWDEASAEGDKAGSAPALSPMQALEAQTAALEQTLSNHLQAVTQAQQGSQSSDSHVNLVLALGLLAAGALGIRLVVTRFGNVLGQKLEASASARQAAIVADEEQAFSKFAEDFVTRSRRTSADTYTVDSPTEDEEPPAPLEYTRPAEPEFIVRQESAAEAYLRNASKDLATIRTLFSSASARNEPAARQKALGEVAAQVATLKARSHPPNLLPVWQMAAALEGLLGQLAARAEAATPSALRTVAVALDVLQGLCVADLEPNLVTQPPVRVLAVDDDAICRHALSFSLSKVLNAPDLASDGLAAMALAEKVAYDVIFLDVEMPGMNGFELCSSIRATETNRATPVVFVTRHSDFETRSQSCLSGGRELLAKPFLTFELAVKALTLVIQRRLQAKAGPTMGMEAPVRDAAERVLAEA